MAPNHAAISEQCPVLNHQQRPKSESEIDLKCTWLHVSTNVKGEKLLSDSKKRESYRILSVGAVNFWPVSLSLSGLCLQKLRRCNSRVKLCGTQICAQITPPNGELGLEIKETQMTNIREIDWENLLSKNVFAFQILVSFSWNQTKFDLEFLS